MGNEKDKYMPLFYANKQNLFYVLNAKTGVFELFSFTGDDSTQGCFEIKCKTVNFVFTKPKRCELCAKIISSIKPKLHGWDIQLYKRTNWEIASSMPFTVRRFGYYMVYDVDGNTYLLTLKEYGYLSEDYLQTPFPVQMGLTNICNPQKVWYTRETPETFQIFVQSKGTQTTPRIEGMVYLDIAQARLKICRGGLMDLFVATVPISYQPSKVLFEGNISEFSEWINPQVSDTYTLISATNLLTLAYSRIQGDELKNWTRRLLLVAHNSPA